jgi:hypothetical protein
MLNNLNETATGLSKIANLISKETLVMWCIFTTFTTGYLFVDGRKTQEIRITELKESQVKLLEEVKGIKQVQQYQKDIIDSTASKVDTTINKINNRLQILKTNDKK